MPRIDTSTEIAKCEKLFDMTGKTEFDISAALFKKLVRDFRKDMRLSLLENGYTNNYKGHKLILRVKPIEYQSALSEIVRL